MVLPIGSRCNDGWRKNERFLRVVKSFCTRERHIFEQRSECFILKAPHGKDVAYCVQSRRQHILHVCSRGYVLVGLTAGAFSTTNVIVELEEMKNLTASKSNPDSTGNIIGQGCACTGV